MKFKPLDMNSLYEYIDEAVTIFGYQFVTEDFDREDAKECIDMIIQKVVDWLYEQKIFDDYRPTEEKE